MVLRNIVKIDEQKCNGCGLCVTACSEGAIQIVNGKAKLSNEIYCDGLGACIGHCPEGAITIEKREAAEFDQEATRAHLSKQSQAEAGFTCPGLAAKTLKKSSDASPAGGSESYSELTQWPVQLRLVPPTAPYFADADLLLVADCVPLAMGEFHQRFLKGRSIVIGCPKLDNAQFHVAKLARILKANKLKSLTVIHMEVPCCSGLTVIARRAIEQSGRRVPIEDITVGLQGSTIKTETITT